MFEPSLQTSFFTGFTLGGSLIVAIGAQNSFVLRQGLRREHVGAVVFVCALLDVLLMCAGVLGLGAGVGRNQRLLDGLALAGAAVLAAYAIAAFRRASRPHALQAAGGDSALPLARVVTQVLSISLLNPHVYLDTVVLVGAVGARQPAGTQGAFLLGSGLASGLWFASLGFGARLLSPLFARPAAWRALDFGVGLTMAWISAQLVLGVVTA